MTADEFVEKWAVRGEMFPHEFVKKWGDPPLPKDQQTDAYRADLKNMLVCLGYLIDADARYINVCGAHALYFPWG